MLFRPDDSILWELTELHVVVTQESVPKTTRAVFLTFKQKHGACVNRKPE